MGIEIIPSKLGKMLDVFDGDGALVGKDLITHPKLFEAFSKGVTAIVLSLGTVKPTAGHGSEDIGRPLYCCTLHVVQDRSVEHTSELQSRGHLVCRILLEKNI